jgi:hypothetical protein
MEGKVAVVVVGEKGSEQRFTSARTVGEQMVVVVV